MPNHTSVAMSGEDLLVFIDRDTDTNWREVLGWDSTFGLLEDLESVARSHIDEIDDRKLGIADRFYSILDDLDNHEAESASALWWVISWPKHVITPRYNSDANYQSYATKDEAEENADEMYGD